MTESDIAGRAYGLYLARGCADGHDVDDWLQAERDLWRGASTTRDALEGQDKALNGKIKQVAVGRAKRRVRKAVERVGNVIKT